MARKEKSPQRKPGRGPQKGRAECNSIRLAIVVGRGGDPALDAAIEWLMSRAKSLGGSFRLWVDRSASDPMDSFRDHDITGGRQHSGSRRYRLDSGQSDLGLGNLLGECQDCRGRIEELVIFHHGSAVDEAVLADRLGDVFNALKVPVCRVVWWSCNAAVSLDVAWDGATDFMMRILGAIARCEPCGCDGPIELIWPSDGRCYLIGDGGSAEPQTNDGKVHRARWGYRQPDGSLGLDPPPGDPHPSPAPPDRDPPHDEDPPKVDGSILGIPVGQRL